ASTSLAASARLRRHMVLHHRPFVTRAERAASDTSRDAPHESMTACRRTSSTVRTSDEPMLYSPRHTTTCETPPLLARLTRTNASIHGITLQAHRPRHSVLEHSFGLRIVWLFPLAPGLFSNLARQSAVPCGPVDRKS